MFENLYIKQLECEIIRLTRENEALRQVKEIDNPLDAVRTFDVEEYQASNEWVVKKHASLMYKNYDEPYRGVVYLKVGQYSAHLYIDEKSFLTENPSLVIGEFVNLIMHKFLQNRIDELKKKSTVRNKTKEKHHE